MFNLKSDPGETKDLSLSEPDRMKQLLKAWDQYFAETQVVWGGPSGAGEVVEMDETADVRDWMSARAPKRRALW